MANKQNPTYCPICVKLYNNEIVRVYKGIRNHERYCVKRGHKITGRSNDLHLIKEKIKKEEED